MVQVAVSVTGGFLEHLGQDLKTEWEVGDDFVERKQEKAEDRQTGK